jgi:transketolase
MAAFTQSEDHAARFKAIGWNTIEIDGNDFTEIDSSIASAKALKNGKPTIIIAKTIIGKGIKEVEGTNAAHGEAGVKFQKTARKSLGLPDELFFVDNLRFFSFFKLKNTVTLLTSLIKGFYK